MVKELPDLANNNTGCSVKFYFQINNEFKKKKNVSTSQMLNETCTCTNKWFAVYTLIIYKAFYILSSNPVDDSTFGQILNSWVVPPNNINWKEQLVF